MVYIHINLFMYTICIAVDFLFAQFARIIFVFIVSLQQTAFPRKWVIEKKTFRHSLLQKNEVAIKASASASSTPSHNFQQFILFFWKKCFLSFICRIILCMSDRQLANILFMSLCYVASFFSASHNSKRSWSRQQRCHNLHCLYVYFIFLVASINGNDWIFLSLVRFNMSESFSFEISFMTGIF